MVVTLASLEARRTGLAANRFKCHVTSLWVTTRVSNNNSYITSVKAETVATNCYQLLQLTPNNAILPLEVTDDDKWAWHSRWSAGVNRRLGNNLCHHFIWLNAIIITIIISSTATDCSDFKWARLLHQVKWLLANWITYKSTDISNYNNKPSRHLGLYKLSNQIVLKGLMLNMPPVGTAS